MQSRPWLTLILVMVIAFLCLAGWKSRANNSANIRWEYRVISIYGPSVTNPPPDTNQLDNEGVQGWELITIRAGEFPQQGSKQIRTDYYFKRSK
ncbi:MAG TPA: hypothetical protein VFY34_01080 [Pyrinomonadaceae bacterium]|nr:hypothetical protein [Pyrinomonadaceae bacterium]